MCSCYVNRSRPRFLSLQASAAVIGAREAAEERSETIAAEKEEGIIDDKAPDPVKPVKLKKEHGKQQRTDA